MLEWFETTGGPAILVEEQRVRAWSGTEPSCESRALRRSAPLRTGASDYDRACAIDDYLGLLPLQGGHVLVLGDEPLSIALLECVGAKSSLNQAVHVARPGGQIGYVGVPHGVLEGGLDVMTMFFKNLTFRGGPAPVRAYMKALMADVLEGTLDPSPVFDMTVDLDGIPEAYAAMDERRALKVLVRP